MYKRMIISALLMSVALTASAQLNYTVQTACHPLDVKHYDTERLRSAFVMEKVMAPDEINLTYTLYDRLIYGGVMPVTKTLVLETFHELKAEHFLARRDLGVINIAGDGIVTVDGKEYAPAYKEYVTQLITTDQKADPKKYAIAISDHYGKMEDSNDRIVNQLIVWPVLSRVKGGGTNQLQMGLTELMPGSVWNTMPAHTHTRRMEAYFYFNVAEGNAICHLMGEPQQERLIWLHKIIVSPVLPVPEIF